MKDANAYFEYHLASMVWFEAAELDKQAALHQSQLRLSPYKGKTPRSRYTHAVYEQALWMLQSKGSPRTELQQAGVTAFSLGDLSEQYDTKGRPSHIAPMAWSFLGGRGVRVGSLK